MKRAIYKTAFVMTVPFLFLVFPGSLMVPLDAFLHPGPDANGHFRDIDPLLAVVLISGPCMWLANWITSYLFWTAGISGERWSNFKMGGRL